jgi:hypothetical protein
VGQELRRTGQIDQYFSCPTKEQKQEIARSAHTILGNAVRRFCDDIKEGKRDTLVVDSIKSVTDAAFLIDAIRAQEGRLFFAHVIHLRISHSLRDHALQWWPQAAISQRRKRWKQTPAFVLPLFAPICSQIVEVCRFQDRILHHTSFLKIDEQLAEGTNILTALHSWYDVRLVPTTAFARNIVAGGTEQEMLKNYLAALVGVGDQLLNLPTPARIMPGQLGWLCSQGRYAVARQYGGSRQLLVSHPSGMFLRDSTGTFTAYHPANSKQNPSIEKGAEAGEEKGAEAREEMQVEPQQLPPLPPGTVLDGELVACDGSHRFYVSDLLCAASVSAPSEAGPQRQAQPTWMLPFDERMCLLDLISASSALPFDDGPLSKGKTNGAGGSTAADAPAADATTADTADSRIFEHLVRVMNPLVQLLRASPCLSSKVVDAVLWHGLHSVPGLGSADDRQCMPPRNDMHHTSKVLMHHTSEVFMHHTSEVFMHPSKVFI